MADYIPADGALLLQWARNFAALTSARPAEYGLTVSEAAEIAQAVERYAQAFARATAEGTRSKADVAAKDAARKAMIALLRQYARIIKASRQVSAAAKTDLGLNRLATGRSRIIAPRSRPAIHIVNAQPLRHFLRFSNVSSDDDGDEQGTVRPANAVGLQLFCHVGDQAPADPLDARFLRFLSRRSHIVEFKAAQRGRTAYYYARWQTATGETGPWSQVAAMTVAG